MHHDAQASWWNDDGWNDLVGELAAREAFVTERGLSRGAKKDRVYGGIYPQYVGVWIKDAQIKDAF